MDTTTCAFCRGVLEPSREFIYQFESLKFCENERVLELIRRMPRYRGEPLRICKKCKDSIEMNQRQLELEIAEQKLQRLRQNRIYVAGGILIGLVVVLKLIYDT